MADAIVIDVEISNTLSEALNRAIAGSSDLSVPMSDIAGHLASEAQLRFETGTDPAGVPWKQSERAREDGGLTLVLSGDLKSSIREDWGPDYAAAGPEASGGAAVYAAIHQFGGTIVPRIKQALAFGGRVVAQVVIPKREYLGWNQESEDYALDTLGAFISGLFGDGATATPGVA